VLVIFVCALSNNRVAVHKVLLAVAVQHVDCVALAVVIKLGAEVNPIEAVRDKAAGDNDDGSLSKDVLNAACALLELPYPALAPARSPTLPSMPKGEGHQRRSRWFYRRLEIYGCTSTSTSTSTRTRTD